MKGRTMSWKSAGFYFFGLVAIQLFVVARTAEAAENFWLAVALSIPFWSWLMTLSVRLFGKQTDDSDARGSSDTSPVTGTVGAHAPGAD